jgi:hypothetical protein
MFKKLLTIVAILGSTAAYANETPIVGNVESKCSIFTDKQGVYGAPLPNTLSTDSVDGGVAPVIRFDVAKAGYYKAVITQPTSFSTSPALSDVVTWTGSIEVAQVSDPLMSAYDTDKVVYNNTTEFDLTVAGPVWFKANSKAEYGVDKSLPAGEYRAVVVAECIAK